MVINQGDKNSNSGGLTKLIITAYKNSGFSESGLIDNFEVMLNPTDYQSTRGIKYNKERIIDGGNIPIYQGYDDETLKFDFTVDVTGTLTKDATINKQWLNKDLPSVLKELENVVYGYNGDSHQPPFLKIKWGTLDFTGRLSKMEVKYALFSSEGKPLRAQITLEILSYVDWSTQNKKKNKSSPDLTHLVMVKAGDTLPLLCERIYQSPIYCTEIARINGLNGFRNLEPGKQLIFPPLFNE